MATHIISIYADSSKESVRSSASIIILSDTVIPADIIPPVINDDILAYSAEDHVIPPIVLEAEAAVVASPTGVLDMIIHSFVDYGSSEDYSDSDSSKRPLSRDSYEAAVAQ
nr:hypothetical protein [Tanacetum cinerariifolium]GFA53273.1 hypothetical protein [Tanacetum cinerariifolium]